jgi:hypothetical protein
VVETEADNDPEAKMLWVGLPCAVVKVSCAVVKVSCAVVKVPSAVVTASPPRVWPCFEEAFAEVVKLQ